MNLKMKTISAVLLAAVFSFAQDVAAPQAVREGEAPLAEVQQAPAIPATPVEQSAPTAPEAPAVQVAPEAPAPVQDVSAVSDSQAVAPTPEVPPANATPPQVEPVIEYVAEEAPAQAPAPAEQVASTPKPAPAKVVPQIYEPIAVRGEGAPVQTVYVKQNPTTGDTLTLDELRGYHPFKTTFGVQANLGSYNLLGGSGSYITELNDYTGMTWRAGLFTVLPLNEYTIALKISALFEQSYATATGGAYKAKFEQMKLDIPLLFSLKSPRSNFAFEVGAQLGVALKDEMKVTFSGSQEIMDLLDKEFRNPIDWSLLFGFSFKANRFLAIDFRIDVGFSELYDTDGSDWMRRFDVDALTSAAFEFGISIFAF